jgi:hypothetical protein
VDASPELAITMNRLIRGGILAVVLMLLFVIIQASATTVTVTITSPANNATFPVGQPVTFMAVGSPTSDAGCPAETYSWSGDDGLSGNGPTVTMVYATPGPKIAAVTYTAYQHDARGVCGPNSASARVLITIQPACLLPPIAPLITVLPTAAVLIGTPVTLQAQAANPPGCSRLDYNWQLLSKPQGSLASLLPFSGPASTLTPDLPGTYQVQVSALNEFGNATAQVTITASAPAPAPVPVPRFPNADLTLEATGNLPSPTTKVGESFTLDFTVMNRGPEDAPEAIYEGDMTSVLGSDFVSAKVMTGQQGESSCTYQASTQLIDCQFALKSQESAQVEIVMTNNGKAAANLFESRVGLIGESALAASVFARPAHAQEVWLQTINLYWVWCLIIDCPPATLLKVDTEPANGQLDSKPNATVQAIFEIKNIGGTVATGVSVSGLLPIWLPALIDSDPDMEVGNPPTKVNCTGALSHTYSCDKFDLPPSTTAKLTIHFTATDEGGGDLFANVTSGNMTTGGFFVYHALLPDADLSVDQVKLTVDGKVENLSWEAIAGQSSVSMGAIISNQGPNDVPPGDTVTLTLTLAGDSDLSLNFTQPPPKECSSVSSPAPLPVIITCSYSGMKFKSQTDVEFTFTVSSLTDIKSFYGSYAHIAMIKNNDVSDHNDGNDYYTWPDMEVRLPAANLFLGTCAGLKNSNCKPFLTNGDPFEVDAFVINHGPLDAKDLTLTIDIDGTPQKPSDKPISFVNPTSSLSDWGPCSTSQTSSSSFTMVCHKP